MNDSIGYGQFCPVAMAAEILCSRWTVLVMREILCGSTRFNELRRGVPRMSPALLSKRLKELEKEGLIERERTRESGVFNYRPTPAGRDAWMVVEAMGIWGQRWIETDVTLRKLDPSLLMWDMRRNLKPAPSPRGRAVIQFVYSDLHPLKRDHWLIVEDGAVDVCYTDPGFEVDLYVETDLATMTKIWMGYETVRAAMDDGRVILTGDARLIADMQKWLGLSVFAREKKRVA